jgi:hypothetical protein
MRRTVPRLLRSRNPFLALRETITHTPHILHRVGRIPILNNALTIASLRLAPDYDR